MPDTPAYSTTRSALPGYAAVVNTRASKSPALTGPEVEEQAAQAEAAIAAMERAEQELADARVRRNHSIAAMHYRGGMTPGQIAKRLDLSTSNVRLIVKTTPAPTSKSA